ncbi:MAG TPA: serine hydrolase domain-containing protein, partial [Thermoanaerobaculia bacterium]|nr:serine hydrolase domain-containing protein [Thermoanaerobaculia bacterium]
MSRTTPWCGDSTRRGSRTAGTLVSLLGLLIAAAAAAVSPSADELGRIDRIFAEAYPAGGPGAAVLVVCDGKPLLRKGYGLAEVELQVPIQPDMVFRVGSVTKQFTSACVLKLVEQGKLRLEDRITKYLPDYPTGGRTVTLDELLTHTSGIHSYTDMPAWFSRMREDWTLTQLVDFFKNEPFDFE